MCAVGESNAGWIEVCRVVDSLFIYFLIFFLHTKVQAVRATKLISK